MKYFNLIFPKGQWSITRIAIILIFFAKFIKFKNILFKISFWSVFSCLWIVARTYLLGKSISNVTLDHSFAGRLTNGWKNAIEIWNTSPIIGDLSQVIRSSKYMGDGGYTETLSQRGILGLIAFILLILLMN